MEHSLVSGSQAGFPRQQSQSGSLPRTPVEVGRFHALVHQNGAGNSAVFVGDRGFQMKAPLQIKVLGELTVVRDAQEIVLPASKKTRALLAYLALANRRQRQRCRGIR